jgi:hypothetical protein
MPAEATSERPPGAQQGTCRPRTESGSCAWTSDCTPDARCVKTSPTAAEGACRAFARVGEGCTAGENLCVFGASCDAVDAGAAGACRAWPGAVGTCGLVSGEVVGCTAAWCDGAADGLGRCQSWKAAGETCGHSRECGPEGADFGGWCDEETHTCVEPGLCTG